MGNQLKYYGNLMLGPVPPSNFLCIPQSKFDKENIKQGRFPGHYYYCNIRSEGEFVVPIVNISENALESYTQLEGEIVSVESDNFGKQNLKGSILRAIGHTVDLILIDELNRGIILLKDPNDLENGRKLLIQIKILKKEEELRIALLLVLRLKESELGSEIPKTNKRFELLWNLFKRIFPEENITIYVGGNALQFTFPDNPSWLELT